jgi:zinc/manganese transport system substrate-binding protein
LKLNKADVLVTVGLELEDAWLVPLVKQARNARIASGGKGLVVSSNHVDLLGVPKGKVDRAEGDVHPGGNPHFYFDPRRAIRVAVALRDRFKELDAKNGAAYDANTIAFVTEAQKLVIAQRNRFKKLPAGKRRVVTYHKSLAYLLDWLELNSIETVEPKPGIPPNPSHVARVLKTMKGAGVGVVIQEEFYPRKTSDTLAKLAKGKVAVIEAGTRFDDGQSYIAHIHKVTEAVYEALSQ